MADESAVTEGPQAEDLDRLNDGEHRWSGWPGAFCLDCFAFDQTEQCLADGCLDFEDNLDDPDHPIIKYCTEHQQAPCPTPRATTRTEG